MTYVLDAKRFPIHFYRIFIYWLKMNWYEHHTIVLSTYVIDELKRVTRKKFPGKYGLLENFLRELPFELVYTPERIEPEDYPGIGDPKDLPVLASAILEDVDILLSGDGHFAPVGLTGPEVLTPRDFITKYC